MKSLILSIILIVSVITVSFAQQNTNLFNHYISVKDALVKGDATTAAAQAGELNKAITGHTALLDKLSADAAAIAKTTDLEQQRKQFKTLSDNFYALSKETKLSNEPVYRMYCPMKKSYWLSTESAIKNPYYGKQMLTCGNVTDTL
jgi:hypothetical protein